MVFGRIPNPTVHIALNQLRKLVNVLITRYGRPDEIVLEFATELKKGRKVLEEILKRQEEYKKKNDYVRGELLTLIGRGGEYRPSRNDIRRYVLWEELGQNHAGRVCVYCGASIGAAQLMNGEAEIEHIIPFSRSLDDSMANLTVAHKRCNLAKGDRSPFEAFGASPHGYNWEEIFERAKNFKGYRKRMRFAPDAIERLQENGGFIASQLTDTAYIAKAARDYLSSVCSSNKVWAIPGQLTAEFRSQWGLNTILSSGLGKNRSDHRHHAIDAIVVGLSDRSMLQAAAIANAGQDGGKIRAPAFALDRGDVIDRLKTVLPSVKPDHGKGGALLAETAYGYRVRMPEGADDSTEQEYEYRVRKPVRSLSFAEIEQRIIDPFISKLLVEHLKVRGIETKSNDKTLEAALVDFEAATGIRRVRIRPKNESGYLHPEIPDHL
jgi:CRISPR-associated endonuclease Csn1